MASTEPTPAPSDAPSLSAAEPVEYVRLATTNPWFSLHDGKGGADFPIINRRGATMTRAQADLAIAAALATHTALTQQDVEPPSSDSTAGVATEESGDTDANK